MQGLRTMPLPIWIFFLHIPIPLLQVTYSKRICSRRGIMIKIIDWRWPKKQIFTPPKSSTIFIIYAISSPASITTILLVLLTLIFLQVWILRKYICSSSSKIACWPCKHVKSYNLCLALQSLSSIRSPIVINNRE